MKFYTRFDRSDERFELERVGEAVPVRPMICREVPDLPGAAAAFETFASDALVRAGMADEPGHEGRVLALYDAEGLGFYLKAAKHPDDDDDRSWTDGDYESIVHCNAFQVLLDKDHDHCHFVRIALQVRGGGAVEQCVATQSEVGLDRLVETEPADDLDWSGENAVVGGFWYARVTVPWASIGMDGPEPGRVLGVNLARKHFIRPVFYEETEFAPSFGSIAAPFFFGDLHIGQERVVVEQTRFPDPLLGARNTAELTFRNRADAPVTVTLTSRVVGQEFRAEREQQAALAPGSNEVSIPYDLDHREYQGQLLHLRAVRADDERSLYNATYRCGVFPQPKFGASAIFCRQGVRPEDAAGLNDPAPDDPDFYIKKRNFVLGRLPIFHRGDGLNDDYFHIIGDDGTRFDLMKAGVMCKIADYLYGLYETEENRILGALFFVHQRGVFRYSPTMSRWATHTNPLSELRVRGAMCGNFAWVMLGILEFMKTGVGEDGYRGAYYGTQNSHVILALQYRDGFTLMDPNIGVFHYNRDNTRFAYLDEFYEEPGLIRRAVLGRDNDYIGKRGMLFWHTANNWPPGAPAC